MISALQHDTDECFVCYSRRNLHWHHVLYGRGNRKQSEGYGYVVRLCEKHHTGPYGVHGANGHELGETLKKLTQQHFEQTRTREDFIRVFGQSYL